MIAIRLLKLKLKYSKKLKLYKNCIDIWLNELKLELSNAKNWNELKHVLVHVIVHLIYFRRDWLKRIFGQPRHLQYFVLKFRCSTTISPTKVKYKFLLLPLCNCLCDRLQDVVLSVCFLSWTHTLLKCFLGSLSVLMPLNAGMPEVLHDLHGLLRTWHVSLHRRPMWNASFSACGLLYSRLWTTKSYVPVSRDERLHKTQIVLEETSCPR